MSERDVRLTQFLEASGWADAARAPIAGDASNRRYERLRKPDNSVAILMDSPADKGEDVRPFLRVAQHLSQLGLSAPKILSQDAKNGFLLLEDLGDDLFARVIPKHPEQEHMLYTAATDVLTELHQHPAPSDLAAYSPKIMTEMAALSYHWYRRGCDLAYEELAETFEAAFLPILQEYASDADVLIQRDYHAENLLWLPSRTGAARVGLLDFQDAMAGHRAYDLVSVLQDARRDVPQNVENDMIDYYVSRTGQDRAQFLAAYHVLGVQRNLRILGVFARLCMVSGKPHYVDFIPRVWEFILRNLSHPALAPVSDIILKDMPTPTDAILARLKEKCATIPQL